MLQRDGNSTIGAGTLTAAGWLGPMAWPSPRHTAGAVTPQGRTVLTDSAVAAIRELMRRGRCAPAHG
jgi:hypothetical protein